MSNVNKLIFSFIIILYTHCIKPPTYDTTPYIRYEKLSSPITQRADSTFYFSAFYEDGEGDLHIVVYQDSRKLFLGPDTFLVPEISPRSGIDDISGYMYIYPFNTLCLNTEADTFYYTFSVIDRQGHISNQDTTDSIIIYCNP